MYRRPIEARGTRTEIMKEVYVYGGRIPRVVRSNPRDVIALQIGVSGLCVLGVYFSIHMARYRECRVFLLFRGFTIDTYVYIYVSW